MALIKFVWLDRGAFCGATGTLCFGLRMILPMSFKVRVDPSSLCALLLLVHNDLWNHHWLLGLGSRTWTTHPGADHDTNPDRLGLKQVLPQRAGTNYNTPWWGEAVIYWGIAQNFYTFSGIEPWFYWINRLVQHRKNTCKYCYRLAILAVHFSCPWHLAKKIERL